MPDLVRLHVDGTEVKVPAGATVAAAVFRSGATGFRHSVSGQPRAPLCGMGICFECRVVINGNLHRLSCQILAAEGMVVQTT